MKFHESSSKIMISKNCSQEGSRFIKCFILKTTCILSTTGTNRRRYFQIFCSFNEKHDKEGEFGLGSSNSLFHEHHLFFDDKGMLVVREVR